VAPRFLSDAELISAVIGTGGPEKNAVRLARELIQKAGGLDRIGTLTEADCGSIAWFGPMKLAQLLAAIELGKRVLYWETRQSLPPLDSSQDAYRLVLPRLSRLKGERFVGVFTDGLNRLLADEIVCEGTVSRTPFYAREVINLANKYSAAALILAHNHPSGDPKPSIADKRHPPLSRSSSCRQARPPRQLDRAALEPLNLFGSLDSASRIVLPGIPIMAVSRNH
jgi:DNA repair protein RadC